MAICENTMTIPTELIGSITHPITHYSREGPSGECDSIHGVDCAELLPSWFELQVGNFYIALAADMLGSH